MPDGCTLFPDSFGSVDWSHCCVLHDVAYDLGGRQVCCRLGTLPVRNQCHGGALVRFFDVCCSEFVWLDILQERQKMLAAILIALKNTAWALPIYVGAWVLMTVPGFFMDISVFLGPHMIAGFGAAFGSVVRFHYLKIKWSLWPKEGPITFGIGLVFGQTNIPFAAPLMKHISPEMFPLANGTLIGLICALAIGGIFDGFAAYTKKKAGL